MDRRKFLKIGAATGGIAAFGLQSSCGVCLSQ